MSADARPIVAVIGTGGAIASVGGDGLQSHAIGPWDWLALASRSLVR